MSRRLALILIALAAMAVLIAWQPWDSERQFDSARWKALVVGGKYCDGERRSDMVSDLLAHHLPAGMTWPKVHRLLGKPHREWTDRPPVIARTWLVGQATIDCAVVYARFVDGSLVEAGWGTTSLISRLAHYRDL